MDKKSKNLMNSCTVKLWYNKNRIKKSGNASLYIQLIAKRDSIEIPLPLEWPPQFINWEKRELMPRKAEDPDLLSYKSIIETEKFKYWEIVRKYLLNKKNFVLTDIIKEARVYKTDLGILEYMEKKIKSRLREKQIKEGTAKNNRVSLKWLREYLNEQDVPLSEINHYWIENYAEFLHQHMEPSSVWCNIKDLKAYLNLAYKKDDLPVNLDYQRYQNPKEESDPTWLEKEEIESLLKLYIDPLTRDIDRRDARAFLFACFTGLRISDLKRWDKSWINGAEFEFIQTKERITKKNKKPIRIPIIPIAKGFIDSLETNTFELTSDQKFNERLKHIAALCGIKKNLTTHVARHTFGTQLAYAGVPVLVISKLLGHKKLETTMVYIHIAEQAKLREMMKLQAAFENYGL